MHRWFAVARIAVLVVVLSSCAIDVQALSALASGETDEPSIVGDPPAPESSVLLPLRAGQSPEGEVLGSQDERNPGTSPAQPETRVASALNGRRVAPNGPLLAKMSWLHTSRPGRSEFATALEIALRFEIVDEPNELAANLTPSDGDVVSYVVAGSVSHEPVGTHCTGSSIGGCALSELRDADVVGIAARAGNSLTVALDWRTYGQPPLIERVSATLRRQAPSSGAGPSIAIANEDGISTDHDDQLVLEVVDDHADGLENAGFIGAAFEVDLTRFDGASFFHQSGSVFAEGVLTVDAAPASEIEPVSSG